MLNVYYFGVAEDYRVCENFDNLLLNHREHPCCIHPEELLQSDLQRCICTGENLARIKFYFFEVLLDFLCHLLD